MTTRECRASLRRDTQEGSYCAQFKMYHDEMKENENEEPPVTEAELARVLELDAKATQGPWDAFRMVHAETGEPLTPAQLVEYFTNTIAKSATESGSHEFYFVSVEKSDGPADVCHVGNGPTSPDNSNLIAEYRTLTPRLARELAAARTRIEQAEASAMHNLKERAKLVLQVTDHIPAAEQIGALEGKVFKLERELAAARAAIKVKDEALTKAQWVLNNTSSNWPEQHHEARTLVTAALSHD